MKSISKKAFIYIIVGLLTFSSVSFVYYRSVHAMEWVGGALAFEEALKWTLAVLGITATAGMTDAYWDEYGDEFVDYAIENGATQQEVNEWQMKLCEGILDKASSVWASFKSWAKSLITSSGGSGGSGGSVGEGVTINDIATYFNCDPSLLAPYDGYTYVCGIYSVSRASDGDYFYIRLYTSPCVATWLDDDNFSFTSDTTCKELYFGLTPNRNQTFWNSFIDFTGTYSPFSGSTGLYYFGFNNTSSLNNEWEIGSNGSDIPDEPTDSDFVGLDGVDVEDIDIISADIPDEDDPEVSLPFPGLDTSDDSISSDTYDDIIGAINDGTISINDGIDDIIGRLRVISYDTETGDVIPPRPDPDDPTENIKKDDVIKENKENMGFTLFGLENVFPFCIPWDIYAFISILEAEPVAPKFTFPFYNPTTKQYMDYEIDLSPWNDVAAVIRYGADFTFIVGLALATRRLIGAGGGD